MNPGQFSGTQRSSPRWAAEFRGRDQLVPWGARLDPTQFFATDAVRVAVTAAVAQNGNAIPVTALTGPIPAGTVLDFGGGKFARVSVAAVTGAVNIAVDPIPTALVGGEVAMYRGTGLVNVPSGTYVGRTIAERDAGQGYGPADPADDERFLTAFDVTDAMKNPDVEFYRPGQPVKENYLPGWAGLSAPVQAAIRAQYICTLGAE